LQNDATAYYANAGYGAAGMRAGSAAKPAEDTRSFKEREKDIAEVSRPKEETVFVTSEDQRISGSFENNRGRLPMPITGPYSIVSHFGQYNVEGLKGVTLDNKGINIKGQTGARARSIFDGEVSAVFGIGGTMGVMVRHGSYISVYCNLSSVSVRKGQKVSTRQVLGTVGAENILQFQLRRQVAKLNPEAWLGR
jgi:septal ring factor EnvC (AmiA/AmiB activator)